MNPRPLQVLSYNIHKGFSPTRARFTLNQMKVAMHSVQADLVFLQEVLGHHENHGKRMTDWLTSSQFDYLADGRWPNVAYGKNAIYRDGHHGNAILSRYPIVEAENLDVSNTRWERRGLLHARIAIPGQREVLHAICVHLDLREAGRQRQVERLCQRIAEVVPHEALLIVAGDFNDWRERVSTLLASRLGLVEVFEEIHGEHARTFPARRPLLRMDRIYVRGLTIRSARTLVEAPWNRLSDHAAVFSELVFDGAGVCSDP